MHAPSKPVKPDELRKLSIKIRRWGAELGFNAIGFAGIELEDAEQRLLAWLEKSYHGEMDYMQRHGVKRSRPQALEPGTLSVISARMNYLPEPQSDALAVLEQADAAYISRYALGRDYHKLMRKKLQQLATRIREEIGEFGYRVFTDSAPVLEKPLAANAGLGWIGKHTNLIAREAGSWFFLGEIYTTLTLPTDLPADAPSASHCGDCQSCIDACPTDAIVAPYVLDARRCISYLTIEHPGTIPVEFRQAMGNRIYGCDDCQLVCPWNRFAPVLDNSDFAPRHGLDQASLLDLWQWDETTFLKNFEGAAIRRIGHQKWLSNIAIALGNWGACTTDNAPEIAAEITAALQTRLPNASELLGEHIHWAISQCQTWNIQS